MNTAANSTQKNNGPTTALAKANCLIALCLLLSGTSIAQKFETISVNPFNLIAVSGYSSVAFGDLDNDGDLDMISGNSDGSFYYFVNTGSQTAPDFSTAATNPFSLTDVGTNSRPFIIDLDGDGLLDVIAGEGGGDINFFKNGGTLETPSFETAVQNPYGLNGSGGNSSVSFADLDKDGDLDFIKVINNGDFKYQENIAASEETIPVFTSVVTNPYNLNPSLGGGGGGGGSGSLNSPAFVDLDGDGDFDILSGATNGQLYFFENIGTDESPNFTSVVGNPFGTTDVGTNSAPGVADLDGDGDLDIMVGENGGGFHYFENTIFSVRILIDQAIVCEGDEGGITANVSDGTAPFTYAWDNGIAETTASLTELALGTYTVTVTDDNSEVVTASITLTSGSTEANFNYSFDVYYQSDADPTPATEIAGAFSATPSGLVIDSNTGAIDVSASTVGEYTVTHTTDLCDVSTTVIIVDEALAFAPKITNPFGLTDVGNHANPTFADLDNDGDQDLLVGEVTGDFYYFQNTGTAELPSYSSPQQNPFGMETIAMKDTPRPTLADMDGDDDFDIIVGFATGDYFYYENEGTVSAPSFKIPMNLSLTYKGAYATPFAADLDGDGDVDLLSGTLSGDFFFYENTAGDNNPPVFASAVTNPFTLSNIGDPNNDILVSSSLGDLDNDGDLDIMSSGNYITGKFTFFQNIGTSLSPSFFEFEANPFSLSNGGVGFSTVFIDLDNDGDLDLFAGTDDGDFFYYRNKLIDNLTAYGVVSQELTCLGGADGALTASPTGGDGTYSYAWDNGIAETTATVSGLAAGTYTVTVTDGHGATSTASITLNDGPLEDADFTYDASVYITTGSNPIPAVATAGGSFSSVPTGLIFLDDLTGEILLSASIPGTYSVTYTTETCGVQISKNIEITNTLTWDGDEGTVWATANNWDFNVAPVSSNVVVIPNATFDPTIFVTDEVVYDLTIQSGASLTIAGGSLTVNGNLQIGGDISVASEAALLPMGSISGDGNATIHRSTTFGTEAGKYSVIGSPITFGNTSSLGSIVYKYDTSIPFDGVGNNRFVKVVTQEFMDVGDAYFSANTGNISFIGRPNSGNVDISLRYTDGSASRVAVVLPNDYALVSNPYTAAISYNNLMAGNTDIDGTLYLWDDGGSDVSQRDNSDYITATSMGAAGGGSTRSADWDGYIRSTQGFFVAFNASGTLHFTPSMMVTSNNEDDGFFRKVETEVMRFALSSNDFYNDILIGFSEEATEGFDRTLDAHKLKGNGDLQLFSRMGEEIMAIQALPISLQEKTIDLGFDAAKSGTYSLSMSDFSESELQIYLIDHSLNKKVNLTEVNTYTFTTSKVEDSHRFSLSFDSNGVLSVDPDVLSTDLLVYSKNQEVFLKTKKEIEEATVSIYTLNGTLIQQVTDVTFKRSKWSTSFNGGGIFIIIVQSDNEFLVSKFHK